MSVADQPEKSAATNIIRRKLPFLIDLTPDERRALPQQDQKRSRLTDTELGPRNGALRIQCAVSWFGHFLNLDGERANQFLQFYQSGEGPNPITAFLQETETAGAQKPAAPPTTPPVTPAE
ncbi:MAG: hypothetical protein M3347_17590 [Armatimonadota bacterium]|nr:hypothetical protein [Armatimonadota bacterium]